MNYKHYFPTFDRILADTLKRTSHGVSIGRGSRYARGAKLAAVMSSEKYFTGQVPGDENDLPEIDATASEQQPTGSERADGRRNRKPTPS